LRAIPDAERVAGILAEAAQAQVTVSTQDAARADAAMIAAE
jgi:hypothetical protein